MFNSINSKERTSNTTKCLIRLELLLLTLLVSPTTCYFKIHKYRIFDRLTTPVNHAPTDVLKVS